MGIVIQANFAQPGRPDPAQSCVRSGGPRPALRPVVDVDATAHLAAMIGRYVGLDMAEQRARAARRRIDIIIGGRCETLGERTLQSMADDVADNDLQLAAMALGRQGHRKVVRAFRDTLNDLLDDK